MFIYKYRIKAMLEKLSREIGQSISLKDIHKAFKTNNVTVFSVVLSLDSTRSMEMFPRIKNSKVMQDFEKIHNAICILDKHKEKWFVKINI